MKDDSKRLLSLIETAFDGVELGNGVSLHETIVIDHYGDSEERQIARRTDEKADWRRLVFDPELSEIHGVGGLTFYDAEGLRFHLPAYLSLAVLWASSRLRGSFNSDIFYSLLYQLTSLNDYQLERFAILNEQQRMCVKEVLLYLHAYILFDFETYESDIDRAIADYWSNPPTDHSE